ncbi:MULTISPECIES: (Na+)-NQR maturation NqrM [Falsihalocynthiibacter]|uniref:(Na+)-NQR maturation NqrM n=1 Tax=Falsihalocynthiibacter TaxID=2854182 RepID=UPI0030032E00
MITFGITLGLILLAIIGLSLGAIFGRAPIKGSCGGLACIPSAECAVCPKRSSKGSST